MGYGEYGEHGGQEMTFSEDHLDRELHAQATNETNIKYDRVILLDFSLKECDGEGGESVEKEEGEAFKVPL